MNYTVDYFLTKFQAIPAEKWCKFETWIEYTQCGCANGHCGVRNVQSTDSIVLTDEARALAVLFMGGHVGKSNDVDKFFVISTVNDAGDTNPKENIINKLLSIKAEQV